MIFIDSDLLVYRVSYGCVGHPLDYVLSTMDGLIRRILAKFPSEPYTVVLSNTGKTFRHDIAVTAPYKGNRKQEKPEFYKELREFLIHEWDAVLSPDGLEADDYIGIKCTKKDVIVTIDKDLLMIPAKYHYWIPAGKDKETGKEKEWFLRKVKRNMYYFWLQMLIGDTADNVKGLKGIGEKTAPNILEGVKLKDMKGVVMKHYVAEFGEDQAKHRFHENANLLWIRRDFDKDYTNYV